MFDPRVFDRNVFDAPFNYGAILRGRRRRRSQGDYQTTQSPYVRRV